MENGIPKSRVEDIILEGLHGLENLKSLQVTIRLVNGTQRGMSNRTSECVVGEILGLADGCFLPNSTFDSK